MQNHRKYPFVQNHRHAKPVNIKLYQNYIWDTLEIDCKEVSVTFNNNKINLPRVVTIKLKDKIKIRCLMKKELLLFHIMLKHGIMWFTLASGTQKTMKITLQKTVNDNIDNFPDGLYSQTRMQLLVQVLQVPSTNRNHGSGGKSQNDERHPHIQERLDHPGHILQPLEYKTPSLIRKMKTYLELEGKLGNQP